MRIGIIGAGQLGQMLGFAARDLDVECRFVDPGDAPPAAICGDVIQRPFDFRIPETLFFRSVKNSCKPQPYSGVRISLA